MNERDFFAHILLNDADAVAFCDTIFRISQVWDDLHDGDKDVTPDTVDNAFWDALITLPLNPFYQRHFAQLQPWLQWCFLDWFEANALEGGDEHDKTVAFVLRDSMSALLIRCAGLVGGLDHARAVGPVVRRAIHNETLAAYLEDLE